MNNRDMKSEHALSIQSMTVLLDPREVATALKVSTTTVHKLVREGKLPCVQGIAS